MAYFPTFKVSWP